MLRKLWESGLSVVPAAGKAVIVKGWSKYCYQMPAESEISLWEKGGFGTNIGLCMGKASGLVCLDIDTDDPEVLKMMPPSTVVRRGKKGEARFFKRTEETCISRPGKVVELRGDGTQMIIPPSVHPETHKAYEWVVCDWDGLTELDGSIYELLARVNSGSGSGESGTGRNNYLVKVATAKITEGKSFELVCQELKEEDDRAHSDRALFRDKSEKVTVEKFVHSVANTLSKKIDLKKFYSGGELWTPTRVTLGRSGVSVAKEIRPYGRFLELFSQVCRDSCPQQTEVLFLGAGLATLSALVGNKVRFKKMRPNVFVLNVAGTSMGKSSVYDVSRELLNNTGLIGEGNYKSRKALEKGCHATKFRTRIDLFDEFGGMLGLMGDKKAGPFQAEMVEGLCGLYSASESGLMSTGYADSKEKIESVKNFYEVILASSTPGKMQSKITGDMVEGGLVNRFLIFNDKTPKKFNDSLDFNSPSDSVAWYELMDMAKRYLELAYIVDGRVIGGVDLDISRGVTKTTPPDVSINLGADVVGEIREARRELDQLVSLGGINGWPEWKVEGAGRLDTSFIKVMVLACMSRQSEVVSVDDVRWARDVILWCFNEGFLGLLGDKMDFGDETKFSKNMKKFQSWLKTEKDWFCKKDVSDRCFKNNLTFRDIEDLLQTADLEQKEGRTKQNRVVKLYKSNT